MLSRNLRIAAIILAAWLFMPGHAFAQSSKAVDYAGLLSATSVAQLQRQVDSIEATSGRQVVILVVPSLGGRAPNEYATWIINTWSIGQNSHGGALLLVARDEKTAYIETTGQEMEFLSRGGLKESIASGVTQSLRKGRAQQGIVNGADSMIAALAGKAPRQAHGGALDLPHIAVIAFVIIMRMMFYRRRSVGGMVLGGMLGGSRRRW